MASVNVPKGLTELTDGTVGSVGVVTGRRSVHIGNPSLTKLPLRRADLRQDLEGSMERARVALTIALVIVGLSAGTLLAQSGSNDWLIGTWSGDLRGESGKVVGRVTMNIDAVTPDGKVQGSWGVTGDRQYPAKLMKLDGAALKVVTAFDSAVELSRVTDAILAGRFTTKNGASSTATLTRAPASGRESMEIVQAPQDVTGKWEGEWAFGGGRGAGQGGRLWISLRQEGDAVTGAIDDPDSNPPHINLATGGTLKGNKLSLKTPSCSNGWLMTFAK